MPNQNPVVPELSHARGIDTFQVTPTCSVRFSEHIRGSSGSLGMIVNTTNCVLYYTPIGDYYVEQKEHTFEQRREFERGVKEAAVRFLKQVYETDEVYVRRINYPSHIRPILARSNAGVFA